MSEEFEFEMLPEPEQHVQPGQQVHEAIDKVIDRKRVLSSNIEIKTDRGSVQIAVPDVALTVRSFTTQLQLLERVGSYWPSVAIDFSTATSTIGEVYVPIDMRDGTADPLSGQEPTHEEIARGSAQIRAEDRARQAGFAVKRLGTREARNVFVSVLSYFLAKRTGKPAESGYSDPPSEEFTVTTDTPGIEILVALGYFISTREGFGISTPARRRLAWGPYVFGTSSNGFPSVPIPWVVPDVLRIHWRV
jgi:hypothetical protein